MGRSLSAEIAFVVAGAMPGPTVGHADDKIPRDFWRILVRKHEPWVVTLLERQMLVETYDIHRLGNADVARLRWTLKADDSKVEPRQEPADACRMTHVAVTDAGLYLLAEDADDAAIAAALKKKPSRSSPPKPYKPTKRNEGRYLSIEHGNVCWGWENVSRSDCDDTCFGEVCVSPTDGVESLIGTCFPGG